MPVRRKSKPSATPNPTVAKDVSHEAALAAPKKKKQSMADVMEEARGGLGRGKVAY
jgi:hypothetical protein